MVGTGAGTSGVPRSYSFVPSTPGPGGDFENSARHVKTKSRKAGFPPNPDKGSTKRPPSWGGASPSGVAPIVITARRASPPHGQLFGTFVTTGGLTGIPVAAVKPFNSGFICDRSMIMADRRCTTSSGVRVPAFRQPCTTT